MILDGVIPASVYSKMKVAIKCDDCRAEYESRFDHSVINYNNYGKHKCKKCSHQSASSKLKGKKRPKEVVEKSRKKHLETNKRKYPKLEIICRYCHKEFFVPYKDRDRIYCSRSCQSKSIGRSDIWQTSICVVCKKEFKHYGERIVCGEKCTAKYLSVIRIGQNNPAYIGIKTAKKCLYCGKEFQYSRDGVHKGAERIFCSLACAHKIDLKGTPLSGIVNEYPIGWRKIKQQVRARDNFKCQLCGAGENGRGHHVHHIDYDKKNIDLENLITLCQKCHNMTGGGRTFWEIIFSGILSGSKIVKKPWGAEIHIVNSNSYCLKYLVFFKYKQFSHHYHHIKKELWHCLYGRLECVLEHKGQKIYLIFKQGDKLEIEPDVVHQLQAIRNSILVEVSTRDYSEDSIRLMAGVN